MKKIIAIDVGNSETTVGVGNSKSWEGYRFTTRKTITSDELLMMFKTIIDLDPIKEIILKNISKNNVVKKISKIISNQGLSI